MGEEDTLISGHPVHNFTVKRTFVSLKIVICSYGCVGYPFFHKELRFSDRLPKKAGQLLSNLKILLGESRARYLE